MSEIKEKKLDIVSGGSDNGDPEEFDWKTKGYVTPIKSGSGVSTNGEREEVLELRKEFEQEKFTFKKHQ